MKSKKFDDFQAALDYAESKGEMKFFGRVGEYYVYTLTIGNIIYQINLYGDGLLEVAHFRYK